MMAGQGVSAGGVRQSPDGSRTGVGEPVRAAALGLKAQVSACCGSERAAAAAHRRKSSPSGAGVGKWFPLGDFINYFLIVGQDDGPTDNNNTGQENIHKAE